MKRPLTSLVAVLLVACAADSRGQTQQPPEADEAACQARLTPALAGGAPVNVTGMITYHFRLQ